MVRMKNVRKVYPNSTTEALRGVDLSIEDGLMNSYTTIEKLPKIRLRFEPIEKAAKY